VNKRGRTHQGEVQLADLVHVGADVTIHVGEHRPHEEQLARQPVPNLSTQATATTHNTRERNTLSRTATFLALLSLRTIHRTAIFICLTTRAG